MRTRMVVFIVALCSGVVVLMTATQYVLVASMPLKIPPLAKNVFAQAASLKLTPTITPIPTSIPTPTPTPTDTPSPTATPTQQPISAPSDLESLFEKYASTYGADKDEMKKIANCESGMNTNARSGDYAGMFQYSADSWSSTRTAMGADGNQDLRTNAEEAIKTTAYKLTHGGASSWPSCR